MSRNKFLLDFDLGVPETIHSPYWVTWRLEIEKRMRDWCVERLGEEGFPNWQFSTRYIHTDDLTSPRPVDIMMADGIFIFDEASRAAFKLTFEL
jgi:hypothetical protein